MLDYKRETVEAIARLKDSYRHLPAAPQIIHQFCAFYADAVPKEYDLTPAAFDNWYKWYVDNIKGGYVVDWDNITVPIEGLINQSEDTYQEIAAYKLKVAQAVFSPEYYQEFERFINELEQQSNIEL